jgi:YVTN family beta-propeller protein
MNTRVLSALASCFLCASAGLAFDRPPETFVNWETPHVHPIDATPNGRKLLVVNTADNRLEVFSTQGTSLTLLASVPVGLDPVSVRARSNSEAWVVNQISDSVSVVNLTTYNVISTLKTQDEPADVVFAGVPQKAFVTCAQPSTLQVFNPNNLKIPATVVNLLGEEPRALAVSADRTKVYAAFFDSGNHTTILGSHGQGSVVSDVTGPYGGQNPPPNVGSDFVPPINPAIVFPPPTVGLIVGKNASGQWHDDNTGDWSDFVSGSRAIDTGRNVGWDMIDNDVAVIDAATLGVSYMTGMMNLCMAIAVHPGDGKVSVVGTEATNVTRFVPVLQARFLRVNLAMGSTSTPNTPTITDLNPHLDYSDTQVAQQRDPVTASQALRDESLGDPRAIVWNTAGTTGYVAGMGSNNVIVIDSTGARVGDPIVVAEGPTGLALVGTKLYVLSKFGATVTTITTADNQIASTTALFDPTPQAIKDGRKELYDTHKTSGLGQIACASCHVDAQTDRIAWDLGDPTGNAVEFEPNVCNLGLSNSCSKAFHPMKGPMMTQTLQDLIGKEPFHWRGDKRGLEDFNGAFTALQGDDEALTPVEMQRFEDFIATVHFPPNPFRNFDNSLSTNIPLTGQFASGRLAGHGGLARGAQMPNGDAAEGYRAFREDPQHIAGPQGTNPQETTCRVCHTLPTGTGADVVFVGDKDLYPQPGAGVYEDVPLGPNGEHHAMMTELTFGANLRTFKPAQLRGTYKKLGYQRSINVSTTGFGFFNDGGEELETFIGRFPHFNTDQKVSNIIAFLMSFSGNDDDAGAYDNLVTPPGPPSLDTHAAVGAQVTVTGANKNDPRIIAKLNDMMGLADSGKIGLVAKGLRGGVQRGYTYLGGGVYQSDHAGETISDTSLRLGSATGSEITMTVVPFGSETRIGIDRDLDGIYDADE